MTASGTSGELGDAIAHCGDAHKPQAYVPRRVTRDELLPLRNELAPPTYSSPDSPALRAEKRVRPWEVTVADTTQACRTPQRPVDTAVGAAHQQTSFRGGYANF
jgi:hypothetical protein